MASDRASTTTVGVVGAAGYAGAELLRLLAGHPNVSLRVATSRAASGRAVAAVLPQLSGRVDLAFTAPDPQALSACDVVFFATPHGAAMAAAPALLAAGCRVIDLSGDFRLQDAREWQRWYEGEHACPALIEQAVYGLPELYRQHLADAWLVACPGCYPTAVALGFKPLLEAGAVDTTTLIADAKTGVSGGGKSLKPGFLFAEAADSLRAYGVAGHRHLPEIRQTLAQLTRAPVDLTFVPHLTPLIRGMQATLYARPLIDMDVHRCFVEAYTGEPFVHVLEPGETPETRHVRATNDCRLAVFAPQYGGQIVVLSVIDNLVKGAAGQAVQCFNVMIGAPETRALALTAALP